MGETVDWPSPGQAWLLCVSEPGVGAQGKAIFTSTDGGRSWRVLVNVSLLTRHPARGISPIGYPLGLSLSKSGFGLLWEDRGPLYVTHDGGHRWQATGVLIPDVNNGLSGAVRSRTQAYLLRFGRHTRRERFQEIGLLHTLDAGRDWSVVYRRLTP